jgi:methanol metabolism-related c-type cytochrome
MTRQENRMLPQDRRIARALAAFVMAAAFAGSLALAGRATAQDKNDEEKPYVVKDGKVDQATYNGWRRYTESCLRCHGPDGSGSSYAPDLTDSLKKMTQEQFNEIVINGRKNVTTSQQNVMPAFGTVEDVALYINDIYAYLKARSDGVLGRGRPERFDRS